MLPQLSQAIDKDSILVTVAQYILHIVFIVLMLTANALMLRFYMKAMQEHGAAKATVYNFAINYLSSVSP